MVRYSSILIILTVLLIPCVLYADLYMWTDKNGKTHISNKKPEGPAEEIKNAQPKLSPGKLQLLLDRFYGNCRQAGNLTVYELDTALMDSTSLKAYIRDSDLDTVSKKEHSSNIDQCKQIFMKGKNNKRALIERKRQKMEKAKEFERRKEQKNAGFSKRLGEAVERKLEKRARNKLSTKIRYIKDGRPVYKNINDMRSPLEHGMTEDEVRSRWGDPQKVTVRNNSSGTTASWKYPMKIYLYFDCNGKLTRWSSY
jgi:hypothetical protein